MKTTHRDVINAYLSISRIGAERNLPAAQLKLFHLKKKLQPAFEFYTEEEKKLIDELKGTVADNGMVIFADEKEGQKKFTEEKQKLLDLECTVETAGKTEIHVTDLKNINLADMEAMEDFIDWKE